MSTRHRDWVIELGLVIGLLAVAAALRFAWLDRLPPGLYHDEAYEGLDALRILGGQTPIYFPANNGREPLYIYLVALFVRLLGRSPGAIRAASAFVGLLTVLVAYLLGRALSGPRVGLLVGAITATTVWTIHLSRLGLRMVTLPLLVGLFLWQGILAYRTGKMRHWIAGGILYGASFYTYLSARVTPIALVCFLFYLLATRRVKRLWPGVVVWTIAAGIVVAPLAVYAAGHWDVVMGRAGQTALIRPELPASGVWQVLQAAPSHALMFVASGDPVPRHNIPSRPAFDPLMAVVFLAGVLLCLANWRRASCAFALVWTGIMLLPSVLSSNTPSFTRSAGVLPVAFVIPALALDTAWTWIRNRGRQLWASLAVSLVITISMGVSVHDYFFGSYATDQAVYDAFSTSAVEMAVEVNRYLGTGWQGQGLSAGEGQPIPDRTLVIDRALWNFSTGIRYLVLARPDRTPNVWFLDTAESKQPALTAQTKLLVPTQDYQQYLALLPHPSFVQVYLGPMAGGNPDIDPFRLYVSFTTVPLPKNVFGPVGEWERVRLQDARCKIAPAQSAANKESRNLALELVWQATQPMDTDYTVFVHVLENGQLVAQSDSQPADGFYPTSWWQPGDWVADAHTLDLPAPFDPARQHVTAGMYVADESGVPRLLGAPIDITDRLVNQCGR